MKLNEWKHFCWQFLLLLWLLCFIVFHFCLQYSKPLQNNWIYYETIDPCLNIFFVEKQLKKKFKKYFSGTRIWDPKPVYQSPKQPGYNTVHLRYLNEFLIKIYEKSLENTNGSCVCFWRWIQDNNKPEATLCRFL